MFRHSTVSLDASVFCQSIAFSALTHWSPVVDEESMRPGHWFGSVLCVSVSASTLSVGLQEGRPSHKIHASYPQMFFFGTVGGITAHTHTLSHAPRDSFLY